MYKNKTKNGYDALIENLMEAFLKIPNIDLVNTDSTANKMFNIICFRLVDMSSFKELVLKHYIPATNKAIATSIAEVNASRYKHLLKIPRHEFQETLFQTIRLSYVGLFHKLESYVNDVMEMADLLIENKTGESVEKFAKRKFNLSLRDWQLFHISHKFNWVSNCAKHYDGFPKKTPKPLFCEDFPEDKRLELNTEEFKRDSEYLLNVCPSYLQIFFAIAQLKFEDMNFDPIEWADSPNYLNSRQERIQMAEQGITSIVKKMKALAAGEEIEDN